MFTNSMINFVHSFWQDEAGYILTAEAVLVGTVGVLGATVGLSAVAQSVNDEMTDIAMAFRSLDQSYHIEGSKACGAWTADSSFTQRPVEESRAELAADIARWEKEAEEHKHHNQEKMGHESQGLKQQADEHHDDQHKGDDNKSEIKKPDPKKTEMKKPADKKPEASKEDHQQEGRNKKHRHHDHDDDDDDDNQADE